MKIDINKKYRTRDGREVKLFCYGDNSVVGEVKCGNLAWCVMVWNNEGKSSPLQESPTDLIEIPKVEVGQYYKRGKSIYIVADIGSQYVLINSFSGIRYTEPVKNIEDIFGGRDDIFNLVNVEIKDL